MDGNQIIDGILAKGNEMIGHLQEAYLFRSSFAYLSTNLLLLYKGIEALKNRKLDEKQIQSLKQLQQSFNHFDSFLPHLSQSKWMQPALNWPVGYVHRLIDGFRKNVILLIEPLGLDKIEIPTSSNSSQNSSNSNSTQNHSNNSNNSSSNNNSNSNNNSSNNSYNSNNNNSSSNNNHNHNNNDINNNNENNGQNSPNSQNSQNTPNSSAEFKSKEKKLFVFDETQDYINRRADFNHFKSSLAGMMSQINTNDAVGIQQQIELKIHEISKILSNNPKNVNDQTNIDQKKARNPSCDFSMIQMKKRVAELLGQFKSINIENDDLMIQAPLGAGGFGSVCKAIRLSTGEIVAVKELRMDRLTMSSWASLYSELEAMASVRHSFVLELVGAHITEPFRIITRFCSGKSLFDRLHRKNHGFESLSPTQLTTIAYQVAVGMEYLHSKNIVHRDLKTLNILLDEYCDGFVADFGLSGMMKDNQDLCGGVGTPNYTAPEVLAHSRYGNKVDIYSYGVVLWELLTKKVPYSEMSSMAIYEHVVTRGWRLPIPNDAPNGLKKLIARCWAKNPSDRPSFSEIVQLFEKENLYLAGSKKIDFMKIKKSKKCPPIAFDYAINVLKDLDSPHFDSVCHYIGNHCDERVRKELRQQNILKNLLESYSNEKNNLNKFCFPESDKENIQDSTENSKNSQKECEKTQNENNLNENHQNLTENKKNFKENTGNMPKAKTEKVNSPKSIGKKGKKKCISDHFNAILTLAEALLENEEEINSFLENGGKEIFKFCITKNNPDFLMAAMSFSLILPKNILFDLHVDLKLIFGFIEKNKKGEITNYFIRFLSNLPISQIVDYKLQIVKLLLEISENINDQETFNSIVSLLPLCMDAIEKNQFRAFYSLLNHDFIVPASFVRTLIQTNDVESYPSLFLNMIRATIKSDLTDVLIHFLQKCKRENTGVIDEIWKQPNFSELTDKLLQSDSNKAALFLLFCIASNEEAALFLADSTILNTLIQMSKLKIQRLQIFTLLCMHESFCEKTTYLDGINHLLVSSLSIRTLTIHAFNLIGALSKHITTCQLLTDNGVLELFTQIFLSSYRGNNSVSYAILRNVAKNISFIPQSSLIVSCLMQELSTARIEKLEILATISSIVEVIPGSVQEHDIQRIIIPEMSKEDPQFALYSLKLLSVCDPSLFRSIYLPVFAIIIKILNNPKMLYPELIESSLDVMIVIVQQYDVSEFIKKTEFIRYLSELLNLIEPTDPLCPSISGFLSILEHIV